MKAFIFIFALIACLMLVRGLPLEEETIQTTATAAAAEAGAAIPITNAECMKVGAFCTHHDDCCTLRCHSYLSRCVT